MSELDQFLENDFILKRSFFDLGLGKGNARLGLGSEECGFSQAVIDHGFEISE